MAIDRQIVAEKLLEYLNSQISLADLVEWAENSFIDTELTPDSDIALLNNVLSYLAAADSSQFPLTWDVCSEFLHVLGYDVTVNAVKTF